MFPDEVKLNNEKEVKLNNEKQVKKKKTLSK